MRSLLQRVKRHFRREDGSSLVETAISCSILLMMMFGVVQLSIAMYDHNYVSDAARQATRYAMVRGSTSCTNTPNLTNCNATSAEIQTWVQGLGFPGITSASVTVTTTWCAASATKPTTWSTCAAGTSNAPGNLVKVSVSYPVNFHIPFMKNSQALTLTSSSEMVIAQ